MKTSSGNAEVNGTSLHYEMAGEGPVVVFIHGFTLDRRMWREVASQLVEKYTVLAYDVRGFGKSSMPGADPYAHREDLRGLLEHLKVRRAHVVGHSIGGHQALEFALAYPELTASYTGVCVSGLSDVPFPPEIQSAFAAVRAAAGAQGIDAARRIWREVGWFTPALERPEVARELDAILADYSGWHWLNQNPFQPLAPPPSARLGEVRVPALMLTGERDLSYNHAIAARLEAEIPGARAIVVKGAGHMAPMEAPSEFSFSLATFLGALGDTP